MTFKEVIILKIQEIDLAILAMFLFSILFLSGTAFLVIRNANVNTERFNTCIQSNPIESCRFIIDSSVK